MPSTQCACNQGESPGALPVENLDTCKMQGHWLLAKMGKRVLRPGGLELTQRMLDRLDVGVTDDVVEFAPGLGVTARLTLARHPAGYTAIEREAAAARQTMTCLTGDHQRCRVGLAEDTGLADRSATVVYGEAMLTMHPDSRKRLIMREAARILKPNGRFGIHEVSIAPTADEGLQKEIRQELSRAIHIGASPATADAWREMLEGEGFEVAEVIQRPFHLLEPRRLVRDEGLFGALRFAGNLLLHPEARRIILRMKRVFRNYREHLNGMVMIAEKRDEDDND